MGANRTRRDQRAVRMHEVEALGIRSPSGRKRYEVAKLWHGQLLEEEERWAMAMFRDLVERPVRVPLRRAYSCACPNANRPRVGKLRLQGDTRAERT